MSDILTQWKRIDHSTRTIYAIFIEEIPQKASSFIMAEIAPILWQFKTKEISYHL